MSTAPAGLAPTPAPSIPDEPRPASAAAELGALPVDFTTPQLTLRAAATGMLLGSVLSLCNIYSGLKIGWGFNMSITSALLAFGFWRAMEFGGVRPFGMLENNVNQTAASAAASVSSAGLVSAMPALTMLTGKTLSWGALSLWIFAVSFVGISVAIGLRRQMLLVDRLPFASGIAAAQTLKEMYARGTEAMSRVKMLVGSGVVAALLKVAQAAFAIPKAGLPGVIATKAGPATLSNLTFALDPSLLMVGVGGLIGLRACVSMLVGAALAYGVVAPQLLDLGWATAGAAGGEWFGPLNKWLLWPGVSMMVTASLTSFAFSWRSLVTALFRRKSSSGPTVDEGDVPRRWFMGALSVALVLSVVCQVALFSIEPWLAVLGVLFSFALAIVAGRVSGETSITPVGPMGKVTQLLFGVIAPGNPAANLMTANVTGGSASQCADLLHDMKTGLLLGAVPRLQAMAQFLGALAGALVGSAAYLVLIPDPANQLLTAEWPAPAAAAWKAVAEVFMKGLSSMPDGAMAAMAWAGAAGVVLALGEKLTPARLSRWLPSPASLGLAFVIPAYNSISMFIGGVVAWGVTRRWKSWAVRFLTVIAAGLVAGESIAGVGVAMQKILGGS